jgi:hypothetical protein
VERGTQVVKHIAYVFVEQAQSTDADGYEQQRLKTLVGSDQDQEFIVLLPLRVQSSRGFNHVWSGSRVHIPISGIVQGGFFLTKSHLAAVAPSYNYPGTAIPAVRSVHEPSSNLTSAFAQWFVDGERQ